MVTINKAPGATNKLDLIDLKTGKELSLGWMDDITDFNFGGDVLIMRIEADWLPPTPTGFFAHPIIGVPNTPIPDGFSKKAPFFADGQWSQIQNSNPTSYFETNQLKIPASKLKSATGTAFTLTMPITGYGNQFVIRQHQTVWVPWDTLLGVSFPGGDIDQFGNVYPVRAHGLNANDHGTEIVGGSPSSTPFVFDSGWGAWASLADSNQQCTALNTFYGSSKHYQSFSWDFWFTQYCGGGGSITARTWRAKDIAGKKTIADYWDAVPYTSQASVTYSSGHGSRTSSWGFVDTGTAFLGHSGRIIIKGDAKTLILHGSAVSP